MTFWSRNVFPSSRAGVRITERNRIFECFSSSKLNWFDVMEVWQTIKYHSPRLCLNFWPRAVFCFYSTEFEGRSSRINWLLTEWSADWLSILLIFQVAFSGIAEGVCCSLFLKESFPRMTRSPYKAAANQSKTSPLSNEIKANLAQRRHCSGRNSLRRQEGSIAL